MADIAAPPGLPITQEEAFQLLGIPNTDAGKMQLVNLATTYTAKGFQDWNTFWTVTIKNRIEQNAENYYALHPELTGDQKPDPLDIKEYLTRFANDLSTVYSEIRDKNHINAKTARALEQVSVESRRVLDQTLGSAGTRIGSLHFGPETLDVSGIRIDEVYPSQRMSTLRSDGEVAVKTGKSMTEITLSLVFSGESINKDLRYLIAELYASPITTIEGSMLADVLVNHFASPELEARIMKTIALANDQDVELKQAIEDFEGAAYESFDTLKEILGSRDLAFEILKARARRASRTAEERVNNTTIPDEYTIESMSASIPVVLNSMIVGTEPSASNTLQVVLKFFRFHHHAFEKYGVTYRDKAGNPTTNIARCPWIRLYSEWAYMNENRINKEWFLSEWTPDPNGPDFSVSWRDLIGRPNGDRTKTLPAKNTGKFVITSISAAYQTKLAVLPLLGNKYPTVHVMGKGGVSARVLLRTTDKSVVREFHLMKDELDAISRNVGGQYRHETAEIENSVLNLLGARNFIITTVSTRPIDGSSDGFEIEFSLEESKYSEYELQSLWLHNTSVPEAALKELWEWLWKQYTDWSNQAERHPDTNIDDPRIKDRIKMGMDILFGKKRDGTGIINGGLINAAMMGMSHYAHTGSYSGYSAPSNVAGTYQYMFTSAGDEPNWVDRIVDGFTPPYAKGLLPSASDPKYHPGNVKVWTSNLFDFKSQKIFEEYNRHLMGITTGIEPLQVYDDSDSRGWGWSISKGTHWSNKVWERLDNRLDDYYDFDREDIFTVMSHQGVAVFNQAFTGQGHMQTHGFWGAAGYISNSTTRGVATLKPEFIKAMFAVMMRPENPPFGIGNLAAAANPDDAQEVDPVMKQKTTYNIAHLQASYRKLSGLFTGGTVLELDGFEWEKFFDPQGHSQVFNTTLGDPDNEALLSPAMTKAYNNYPDMPLPTYQDFFGTTDQPGFAASDQASQEFRLSASDLSATMKSSNGESGRKPLWMAFAPTYSDLGRIPPPLSLRAIAQTISPLTRSLEVADLKEKAGADNRGVDRFRLPMEPGFWFYKKRLLQNFIHQANANASGSDPTEGSHIDNILGEVIELDVDTEYQNPSAATINTIIENSIREEAIVGSAETRASARVVSATPKSPGSDPKDGTIQASLNRALENKQVIDLVSTNNQLVGHLIPDRAFQGKNAKWKFIPFEGRRTYYVNWRLGRSIDLQGTRGNSEGESRTATEYHRSILTRMIQQVPDDFNGIERLHPAYRVYFIEWDDNRGRNSPTRGGVRQVRMMDDLYTTNAIMGIHVTDRKDDASVAVLEILNTVGTFDKDSFVHDQAAIEEKVGHDDASEDFLSRMKLKTGVGIMIKMGYTSDMNSLKTVFSGRIAEIQPGKVLRLIAQGWKTELDQEVDFGSTSTHNDRAALSKVVNDEKRPTPHLGRQYDSRDLTQADLQAMIGDEQAVDDAYKGWFGTGRAGFWARQFGATFTTVERNIWFSHMADRGWLKDIAFDITPEMAEGWFFDNRDKDWYFYRTTMWEATQEIVRANPGLIAAVVPFDTEATLFVGYPNQVYFWRTPTGIEEKIYQNFVRPYRIQQTIGGIALLLQKFFNGPYGTNDKLQEDADYDNATFWGNHQEGNGYDPNTAGDPIGLGNRNRSNGFPIGSRLGLNFDGPEDGPLKRNNRDMRFSFLSKSYTGFMKWAMAQPFYASAIVDGQEELDNPFSFIPFVESEQYDLRSDWSTINSFNPALARFLVAWFFKLKFVEEGGWLGANGNRVAVEGQLMSAIGDGFSRLREDDNTLSDPGRRFYELMLGDDLEGEEGSIFSDIKYGSIYSDFWSDPEKFTKEMVSRIEKMMKSNLIPQDHGKELIEQLEIAGLGKQTAFVPTQDNPDMLPMDMEGIEEVTYAPEDERISQVLSNSDVFDLWNRFRDEAYDGLPAEYARIDAHYEDLRQKNRGFLSQSQQRQWEEAKDAAYRRYTSSGLNSGRRWEASGGGDFVGNDYTLGHVIWANFRPFRVFIHYFAEFLKDKSESGDILEDLDNNGTMDFLATTNFPPWYKAFREYHLVQSGLDIIDNTIVATESQMANAVLVRGPDGTVDNDEVIKGTDPGQRIWTDSQSWESYPKFGAAPFQGEDKVSQAARRLFVAMEPNANSYRRRAAMLTSNMAAALRPMYRGRLKMTGRVMKPHDLIYVNDHINAMYGPVEIDVVVHEFTPQTGWITTIEPHAFTVAENPWAVWENSFWEDLLGILDVLDYVSWAAFLLSVVTLGGSLLVAAGAKVTQKALRHIVKRQLIKKIGKDGYKDALVLLKKGTITKEIHVEIRKAMSEMTKKGIRGRAGMAARSAAASGTVPTVGQALGAQVLPLSRQRIKAGMLASVMSVARRTFWVAAGASVARGGYNMFQVFNGNGVKWTSDMMPYMPVTLYPLSLRGLPFVAGLELREENVMSFGAKAERSFAALMDSFADFVTGDPERIKTDNG